MDPGGTSKWGSTGSNGGVVTLNLKNQNVVGNFVVDEYSGLTINLENSSIQGTINSEKTGAKVAINIDESSTITLTGNSYYTSINNGKSDGSNIIKGSYGSFNNVLYYTYPEYYEGKIVSEVNKLGF